MRTVEIEIDENDNVVLTDNVPTNYDCKFIRDLYKSENVPTYWYDYIIKVGDKKKEKINKHRVKKSIKELEQLYTLEQVTFEVENQLGLDELQRFNKKIANDKDYLKLALKMGVKLKVYDTKENNR